MARTLYSLINRQINCICNSFRINQIEFEYVRIIKKIISAIKLVIFYQDNLKLFQLLLVQL